jgi:gliding motility-associated-like protein
MQPFTELLRVIKGKFFRSGGAKIFMLNTKPLMVALWVLLLLTSWMELHAQQEANVSCLSVDANGSVTVNWAPPAAGSSDFSHYEVFYSISPQLAFTSIANNLVPYALSSFTHNSNLALTNDYYYYVQAWYTNAAGSLYSVSSDTLSTIYLDADPAQNICANCDSAAYLEWNEPWLPVGTNTENLEYQIWIDYPTGAWELLATVPFGTNDYIHYVYNCFPITMNFFIQLATPNGCEFVSNEEGDQFSDNVFPYTGLIEKIEMNADEDVLVQWEHDSSSEIAGYVVYRCIGNGTDSIGFVDSAPWQFLDFLANEDTPNEYKIAAYDACKNRDTSNCYLSSFLQSPDYVLCDTTISLQWNDYGGWENSPSYYLVYKAFEETADFASAQLAIIDTVYSSEYTDVNVQYLGYNIYRIEAIDTITDYRAFTNYVGADVRVDPLTPPENLEVKWATVVAPDEVEVVIGMTPTFESFRYELQRFEPTTDSWEELFVQDLSAAFEFPFLDTQRATDVFSYTYRFVVSSSCGVKVATTNVGKTIALTGTTDQTRLVNTLSWNPYLDWKEGVDVYRIYRRFKNEPYELIHEMNGGSRLFYDDNVSELIESDGEFIYCIEAVEKTDGSRSPYTSKSNEISLSVDPIIWIPNTIVIGGYNDVFKPVISYALVEEYYLSIFSRWGDHIFETHDIENGWDGYMDGRPVQEGEYNYYFMVKDGRGRAIDRFGYIIVLNND